MYWGKEEGRYEVSGRGGGLCSRGEVINGFPASRWWGDA